VPRLKLGICASHLGMGYNKSVNTLRFLLEEGVTLMGKERKKPYDMALLQQPREYFNEVVRDALTQRKVKTSPLAESYIVQLLEHFVSVENLFEEDQGERIKSQTPLAEMFLKAVNSPVHLRVELLKRLGDTSLYVSGFFGDSLTRKVVDIDYYAEMGGAAYQNLSTVVKEGASRQIYQELASKFLEFVEILTFISSKTLIQSNQNLLRLYDRYVTTGSKLAREQLLEQGLLTPAVGTKKSFQ